MVGNQLGAGWSPIGLRHEPHGAGKKGDFWTAAMPIDASYRQGVCRVRTAPQRRAWPDDAAGASEASASG